MTLRAAALALAAFMALADAAIAVLALPPMLVDLDTTVVGVASVIAVYTGGVAATVAVLQRRARSTLPPGIGTWGCALFGIGALVCAVSPSIAPLVAGRLLQSIGGGAVMLVAFDELRGKPAGGRLWTAIATFGLAAGPALGGVLTEIFGWRSIFGAQVPVAVVAAVALARAPSVRLAPARRLVIEDPGSRRAAGSALVALSGALTGVLFLLILLLVAGWATSPLTAAAAVTVLPLAAIAGGSIPGRPARLAVAGAALVAAGTAPLAFVPNASLAWVVGPQVLAGLGMGMSIGALAGGLLPESTTVEAARLLVFRHVGMTLVLAALAPVVAHELQAAVDDAKLQGTALVLDAAIDPVRKVALATLLVSTVDDEQPRAALRSSEQVAVRNAAAGERPEVRRLTRVADDVLVGAVNKAFRLAFLIAAAFALLAAVLLVPRFGGARVLVGGVLATALATGAYAYAHHHWQPDRVALTDPCGAPAPPAADGLPGKAQRLSLQVIDQAACHLGSSREELVLALADDRDAERFEERHGVNPRSAGGLLRALFGG
ncbi:MAG TPA: MFS transporter [Solirubrobacteraceae bacterium]|jgi:predicted MFS family arabinose efflux permease